MAPAELSVECGDDSGAGLDLPAEAIAEKFMQYYWRQSVPFLGQDVLSQCEGRQPVVMTLLAAARDRRQPACTASRDRRFATRVY